MSAIGSQDCPICGTAASIMVGSRTNKVDCSKCGQYEQGIPWSNVADIRHRVLLSGWVREQNASGNVPIVTQEVCKRVATMRLPRLRERAMRALAVIARKYPKAESPGYGPSVEDLELQASSYSTNADDVRNLFHILEHEHLIRTESWGFFLTAKGLLAVDDMAATSSASAQCFVAMSFDASLSAAWTDGFDPGIRAAGFRPVRIDRKDYIGGITDEIMSEIRRSRFVVADYTGQRGGVYFEAGFALGLGLPVIPTCREDEVDKLHFDIRHLNTLPWPTPEELAINLARRVQAVIGEGPDPAA
jgi:hypothetical protein